MATKKKNAKSSKSTKKQPAKRERRARGLSYKDVQLTYLCDGIAEVKNKFNGKEISKASLRRAITELNKIGRSSASLTEFADSVLGSGSRGRSAPKVGDVRSYRVQKVKGSLFIRMPLETLGVDKGDIVNVSFNSGNLNVVAASIRA